MLRNTLIKLLGITIILAAVGCANPAADAPQAQVQEAAEVATPEPAPEDAVQYSLEGTIGFVGSKVTGTHEGGFESFEGTVSLVEGIPEMSKVEVTIDTTSIWSDSEKLTGHLMSDDFFAVETYPTATFESTEIVENPDGTYTMTGNLDLHGVTKQISFPAEIKGDDQGFTAKAEFSIMRFDFGIVYPGKTDDLIRDDVLVKLDLQSTLAEEADAMEEPAADETTEDEGEAS